MTTYKDGLRAIIERAMWASGPIIEALDDIERLEAENEKLKHNTDAIWDIYQSSKRENAALREKLVAANKRADTAVEDMKRMDRYITTSDDPYSVLCQVCKYKPQAGEKCKRCDVYDNTGFEWRGPKRRGGENEKCIAI